MTDARRPTEIRGHGELADSLIAVWAWASTSTALVVGVDPGWGLIAVLAVPMIAFACLGHVPGRGAVVGLIVVAVAMATVRLGREPIGGWPLC